MKPGAHTVIRRFILGFMLWIMAFMYLPQVFPGIEGALIIALIVGCTAVIYLVIFHRLGSTWEDQP